MKKIFLFVAIIMIMSCEKYDNTCNCENPIEDIPWLDNLKSSLTNCGCQMSIFQATYNKETVFYDIINDPRCNTKFFIALRDCKGDTLKVYDDYSLFETFKFEVTNNKNLYTCKTEIPGR